MASPARKQLRRHVPARPSKARELKVAPARPVAGRRTQKAFPPSTPAALVHELSSCVTEADIVQVLYRGLEALFGYNIVVLHSLERKD